MRTPTSRRGQRGYAMLTVFIILALLSAAVGTTMDEAARNLRTSGLSRTAEMMTSGLEHGIHLGSAHVRHLDSAVIVDPRTTWDIFDRNRRIPATANRDMIGPFAYPPRGPDQARYVIRLGLRPAQRARAPAGEDVRFAYGQVVELQVGVESNVAIPGNPTAEERVSVGLLIPRRASHAP